jgi:DNA repair exonuclease SbcCD nuclease subunit
VKFIYIADTHFGGKNTKGFFKQTRYLDKSKELLLCLKNYISEIGGIDFIIHGGDIIDECSAENIQKSIELMDLLECKIYLALGNHDLTVRNSAELWKENAVDFFAGSDNDPFNFVLNHNGVAFDIRALSWGSVPMWWQIDEEQCPYWTSGVDGELLNDSKVKILVTHSPVFGLPVEQTGFDKEIHPPQGDFLGKVLSEVETYGYNIVLGAHNHMNMRVNKDGVEYVTASSFTEAPFEFKLFEIDDNKITMQTLSLADRVSFKYDYDSEASYVQGEEKYRSFVMEL